MYRVVKDFIDLYDNKHLYRVGDIFPRAGMSVTQERLAILASDRNKLKRPLIREDNIQPDESLSEESKPEPEKIPEPTEGKPKRTRKKKE